jgi:hypothetical protein
MFMCCIKSLGSGQVLNKTISFAVVVRILDEEGIYERPNILDKVFGNRAYYIILNRIAPQDKFTTGCNFQSRKRFEGMLDG